MSRQYNPAVSAYNRMDIDSFNKLDTVEEPKKTITELFLVDLESLSNCVFGFADGLL